MTYKINFPLVKPFVPSEIRPLVGIVGLYFISLRDTEIKYPFKESRLIYIGMSERQTNSIGNRLMNHYSGKSGNLGLTNYRKSFDVVFTYLNFDTTKEIWNRSIEDLESYFILDFVKCYGVYPICNNKSGYPDLSEFSDNFIEIDWTKYE